MKPKHFPAAIITGPTATGKSSLVMDWARADARIEIINSDPIQMLQGFTIGSAKPSERDRLEVPHHLVDILPPSSRTQAHEFARSVEDIIIDCFERKKIPVLVGGAPFYVKAFAYRAPETPKSDPAVIAELEGVDSQALLSHLEAYDFLKGRISIADRYRLLRWNAVLRQTGTLRPEWFVKQGSRREQTFVAWLDRDAIELETRITQRVETMLAQGLLIEVRDLLLSHPEAPALDSVGYLQAVCYWRGQVPAGRKIRPGELGLLDEICLATRQMVKSTRTFLRSQIECDRFILDQDRDKLQEWWNTYISLCERYF